MPRILFLLALAVLAAGGAAATTQKEFWLNGGTEPMCKDGTCHQAHSVILKNMDVDNFPQVRIFVDTRLKHYPQIVLLPSQLKLPTFTFKDAAGKEIEDLDVGGMFVHEMEEELAARGIKPTSH